MDGRNLALDTGTLLWSMLITSGPTVKAQLWLHSAAEGAKPEPRAARTRKMLILHRVGTKPFRI